MFIVLTLVPNSALASDFSKLEIVKDKYMNSSFANEKGKFIVPNEDNYSGFSQVKFASGVLISVGTFRSLAMASMGQFSHVVLFDADPGVVEFNKWQIEVLKRSSSVAEFLGGLAGKPEMVEYLKEMNKQDAEGAWARSVFDVLFDRELQKIRGAPRSAKADLDHATLLYVGKLVRMASSDLGHSFLTNSKKYEKLRRLALENKILVVHGSLTGDRAMKSLALKLKELNLSVGTIDVSNFFEYIIESNQSIINYTDNLEALPFEKSALVQLTNGGYPDGFHSKTLNADLYKKEHSKLRNAQRRSFEYLEDYKYWIDVLIEDSNPCLKALSGAKK